jgi:CheY-like chemotaxis protein
MPKRVLSISYDPPLLWTRQLLLEKVVSAEGFANALELCESWDGKVDLIVLGHSIPSKDRQAIINHIRKQCPAPVLALLRPNEHFEPCATRSVDAAQPDEFLRAVRELLALT